ncbi:MAG TPA: carboxypeptidase regulatory-like domain-containing protein [Terracidiphilus sp.]|nr:carboxypeptidase regulatory-like domain-containing protein [Terracidiphilus sp.]
MCRSAFSLFFFLVFATLTCFAQYSGNVQGIVADQNQAAITNATILLRSVDTGIVLTTTSDNAGFYRFSSLAPGNYVVSVEAPNFRKEESQFTLSTAETKGINLTMHVATTQQSVVVEVTPPTINTDDSRLEATLESQTVRDLPEANRNLWDTLAAAPGVSGTGTRAQGESPGGFADNFGTQTPAISANGRSYIGNVVMVDGMNVTSPVQNGNLVLSPIPEAVQEETMQTNSWDGDINLGSSILVQVTTKSGTNKFHGAGSLFYTNQDLEANTEFSNATADLPFGRKDLVGALGGPIWKNKTFFYADFEKLWATTSAAANTGNQTFEDPAFVAWASSAYPNTVGTQILTGWPAKFMVPNGTVETALTAFGQANCYSPGAAGSGPSSDIPCGTNVIDNGTFAASPYYNALQYNFRVDQYFTPNDRLYLSYYNDGFTQQQLSPREGLQAVDIQANRYGQADITHTFNAKVLWETAFAFASVGGANGQDADLKVPAITVSDVTEGFQVGGGFGPGEYRGPMYNWRSVLSLVHGRHVLKFGYDGARGIEHGDFTPDYVRPSFTFGNLLTLVEDTPVSESATYNPLTGQPAKVAFGGQENPFGFYVQDDWKAKPNLALTISLRWDDFTNHIPWGNSGFQFSALMLGTAGTITQQVTDATVGVVPQVFARNMTNIFSPRIGFSWDPTSHGNWVVRGGVGVYHDWIAMGQTIDQTRLNPPGVIGATFYEGGSGIQPIFGLAPSGTYPFNFTLPTIPATGLNAAGGLPGVQASVDSLDRNMVPPLSVNYVIGVEHELAFKLVAGASYSGSKSYDQLTGYNINRYAGGAVITDSVTTACPNPPCETVNTLNSSFGPITYVTNARYANYNAMILTLRGKQGSRGNFQASYTLAQAKDYPEENTRFDQDTGNIPDQNAYFSYYGLANYDVRQRVSASGGYTIPGMTGNAIEHVLTSGWELTSILAAQSGSPFWVYNTNPPTVAVNPGDYNLDGVNWDVPNTPTQNFTGGHTRLTYINGVFGNPTTGAAQGVFPAPAAGTEGTEPRNMFTGPGMVEVDASLLKNTHLPHLGEQGNLQLRFDLINLFNRVNLGPVDGDIADGTFGQSRTALPARALQMGARFAF